MDESKTNLESLDSPYCKLGRHHLPSYIIFYSSSCHLNDHFPIDSWMGILKLPCYEFQYLFQNSNLPCVLKLKCQNCMLMILKSKSLLLKFFNNFNQFWMFPSPYHIIRFWDVTHNYKMSKMDFNPHIHNNNLP